MRTIKPTLIKKQPLFLKEALWQDSYRELFITKLRFLLNFFSYKNHESVYFDYLIIGSNPLLNHLLIQKIHEETNLKHKKHIKIGLIVTDNDDHWGYHSFENPSLLKIIENKTAIQANNLSDYIDKTLFHLLFSGRITLTLIESHNFSIKMNDFDPKEKIHILHLTDKEVKHNEDIRQFQPTILKTESVIMRDYQQKYTNQLRKIGNQLNNVNRLIFNNKKQFSTRSKIHSHIIFSKNIFLTSFPHFLTINNELKEIKTEISTFQYPEFIHFFSNHSFGTAKRFVNFLSLEQASMEDVINVLEYSLDENCNTY